MHHLKTYKLIYKRTYTNIERATRPAQLPDSHIHDGRTDLHMILCIKYIYIYTHFLVGDISQVFHMRLARSVPHILLRSTSSNIQKAPKTFFKEKMAFWTHPRWRYVFCLLCCPAPLHTSPAILHWILLQAKSSHRRGAPPAPSSPVAS